MSRPERTIVELGDIKYVPQRTIYAAEPALNPWKWEDWGPPTYTELYIGLRPGLRDVDGEYEVIPADELDEAETLDEDNVVELLHERFAAASIVRQIGKEKGKPPEPSLRVVIYHDPSEESVDEFDQRIAKAVEDLARDLFQQTILLHKVVEGNDEGTFAFSWSRD